MGEIKIPQELYRELQAESGQLIKNTLEILISTGEYQELSDEDKINIIYDIVRKDRATYYREKLVF